MGLVDRSAASLRVIGDDLDPDYVSELLGHTPSQSYRRGDTLGPKGRTRIAKCGFWGLDTDDTVPADVNAQIALLLAPLTDDLSVWAQLAASFRLEMFVGLFSYRANSGLTLGPESLRLLADRQIVIDFDIYGPLDTSEEQGGDQ